MSKMSDYLTDWFAAEMNPVHVGVYQVNRGSQGIWFRFWTGTFWSLCAETPNEAAAAKTAKSPVGAFPWRGVYREIS